MKASVIALYVCLSLCSCSHGAQFVTYIDNIESWYPATAIATALGVPGYAPANDYTTINLSFWLNSGPADAALLWSDPLTYVGTNNPWGQSNSDIQTAWVKAFHSVNQKVLVSAFGATEFPTTAGDDPVQTAQALAQFVKDNQLDGVDLDYEDNNAMNSGAGVNWVINCTLTLRQLLPSPYIITHAPQAPYFMSSYPQGGYLTVDKQAGSAINWYNVQFYNQGSSDYSTYDTLFTSSDGWANGTAVTQIAAAGVDINKLVVGKPVTAADATNTGYVDVNDLASFFSQALSSTSWSAGAMGWEYSDDMNGSWVAALAAAWH